MSSPIVFSLTRAQAQVLAQLGRRDFKDYNYPRVISTLERRHLVQQVRGTWRCTVIGEIVRELIARLNLHQEKEI